MDVAIRAEVLSKHYRIYRRPADRVIEFLSRRPRHTVFPALEEVSFEVERGETIGVIGQNGAGKSTLLKLLCGVTLPSSGSLQSVGTLASILELGAGFHPEFSGRDNAALNAALMGLSPEEIDRRLPAILQFSELGTFLDRPVKTYSSGMYMRLAFSVAVNVDPDILIIDEALAVGDGHFQKKCMDKIREFQQSGKTILFCSHALYYVSSICRRTIWLDHGKVMRFGPSLDVIREYESFLLERNRVVGMHEGTSDPEQSSSPVRFRSIVIQDSTGNARDSFATGEDIVVAMSLESDHPRQPIHLIVGIHRSGDDLQCFAVSTHADDRPPLTGRSEYEIAVRLRDVPLLRGEYTIIAFAGDENAMSVFDRRDIPRAFHITGDRYDIGLIAVDHEWLAPSADASRVVSFETRRNG